MLDGMLAYPGLRHHHRPGADPARC